MDSERFPPFVLFTERIAKNIKRIADIKLEPYGLRSSHLMCILQLAKSGNGLSSSSLAEVCGVDKAFISRITGELSEKNYIVRDSESARGKYKTRFVLTDSGKQIYRICTDVLQECIERVDTNISKKKLEIFYEVLAKIDLGVSDLLKKENINE
ncbi:MAG: hypothetical protein J6B34_02060 [Clostridia bacterium]|nr:hypothetical protein [Clostridia bacterium]